MKYLSLILLASILGCGGAPQTELQASQSTTTNNSATDKNEHITSIMRCSSTNVTYRVGTQIDFFYEVVTFDTGIKYLTCTIKTGSQISTHSEYVHSSSSLYANSTCDAWLDLNDTSGGYWRFTGDRKLIYFDTTSPVAGLLLEYNASLCTTTVVN